MVKVTDNIPDDPSFTTLANNIEVGSRVQHLRFGKGEITALEGTPPNVKATILFDQIGEKQLLLKFAKLKIIK